MEDLISIIIPVYNAEKYLNHCLETVVNQTYKNIEIILINDGSTDNSIDIIKEYQQKDDRIVVIDRKNKGVLYTRVEGLKIAKGKYVSYIDSDDWAEENMIEILYNRIIKYDADVVKCQFGNNESNVANGNFNIKQDVFLKKESFEPTFFDMFLVNMNIHNVWCQMFKRELIYKYIDNIDTNISMGDDLELNIQLYKNINSILFMPDVLYHYRYNDNSITKNLNTENIKKKVIDITKAYCHAYESIEEFDIKDKVKYKQGVLKKLLDEVNNYQIDLIGNLKSKKESIKYLKWYYFEYKDMKKIKREIEDINFDTNELKYKIFYRRIYSNITLAYSVGMLIWIRRVLLNKRK